MGYTWFKLLLIIPKITISIQIFKFEEKL